MVTFHIVPEEFCIPFNGILGSEYFLETKAMLNFETRQLTVGERSMKFKQNEKLPSDLKVNGISKWNKNIDIYIYIYRYRICKRKRK